MFYIKNVETQSPPTCIGDNQDFDLPESEYENNSFNKADAEGVKGTGGFGKKNRAGADDGFSA